MTKQAKVPFYGACRAILVLVTLRNESVSNLDFITTLHDGSGRFRNTRNLFSDQGLHFCKSAVRLARISAAAKPSSS